MVDNCYGEFVDTIEPSDVGADIMVGSLIKNPGGGLAPIGGYIAGRKDCVENASYRMTLPGTGHGSGGNPWCKPFSVPGIFPCTDRYHSSFKRCCLCCKRLRENWDLPLFQTAQNHVTISFRQSPLEHRKASSHSARVSRQLHRSTASFPGTVGYARVRQPGHHGSRRFHAGLFHRTFCRWPYETTLCCLFPGWSYLAARKTWNSEISSVTG